VKPGARTLLAGGFFAVAALVPTSASAHGAIDQRQAEESSCWSIFNFGPLTQSFTAGITGELTDVTARVLASRGGTYTVSLALYAADSSGGPTGSALAEVDTTYNVGSTPGAQVKTTLEFSLDAPVELDKGEAYVLEISETGYRTSWCAGTGNPYAAGVSSVGAQTDFAFATFMEVHGTDEEPDHLSGVGFGAAPWLITGFMALGAGLVLDLSGRRRSSVR